MKRLRVILPDKTEDTDVNELLYKSITVTDINGSSEQERVLGYIDYNGKFHPYKHDYNAISLLNNIIHKVSEIIDDEIISIQEMTNNE